MRGLRRTLQLSNESRIGLARGMAARRACNSIHIDIALSGIHPLAGGTSSRHSAAVPGADYWRLGLIGVYCADFHDNKQVRRPLDLWGFRNFSEQCALMPVGHLSVDESCNSHFPKRHRCMIGFPYELESHRKFSKWKLE